jgi:hypothetical protein
MRRRLPGPMPAAEPEAIATALDLERRFVLTLGGFSHEIAGATLVTLERVPAERFNYADVHEVSPQRLTALVERSLDHYFQRAIRPVFRVPEPVPEPLDAALRRVGFLSEPDPVGVFVSGGSSLGGRSILSTARRAERSELDALLPFWAPARARLDLRAAIDNAWAHPNPQEELVPMVTMREGTPAGAGIVYAFRGARALVLAGDVTDPAAGPTDGALLDGAVRDDPSRPLWVLAPTGHDGRPSAPPGFRLVRTLRRFRLSPKAQLDLGPLPPPGPPRWRPPR